MLKSVKEFSSENIRFWCSVNDYRSKFDAGAAAVVVAPPEKSTNAIDDEEAGITLSAEGLSGSVSSPVPVSKRELAIQIYNNFIEASESQVNLSSLHRCQIREGINLDEITRDLFDVAQKEIFSVMARDSYPRFLASKERKTRMGR